MIRLRTYAALGVAALLITLALIALAPELTPRDPCRPLPSMFATDGQCRAVVAFEARAVR